MHLLAFRQPVRRRLPLRFGFARDPHYAAGKTPWMQDTIHALLALQELDTEIYRLKDELRRLPQERAQRRTQIDGVVTRKEETAR